MTSSPSPSSTSSLNTLSSTNTELIPQRLPEIVDLNKDAVDLARSLDCRPRFLRAARRLLTAQFLSPAEFWRHARKIICLVEIAQRTLVESRVLSFRVFSLPSFFHSKKIAYIRLLKMLHSRRHHVDTSLQDRLNQLLQPLYTLTRSKHEGASAGSLTLTIGAVSPESRPERLVTTRTQQSLKRPCHQQFITNPETDVLLMPPPDKFPAASRKYQYSLPFGTSTQKRLWDPSILGEEFPIKGHKRAGGSEEEFDRENNSATSTEVAYGQRLLRPLPRRFGIFCTKKITMHRQKEIFGQRGGSMG